MVQPLGRTVGSGNVGYSRRNRKRLCQHPSEKVLTPQAGVAEIPRPDGSREIEWRCVCGTRGELTVEAISGRVSGRGPRWLIERLRAPVHPIGPRDFYVPQIGTPRITMEGLR